MLLILMNHKLRESFTIFHSFGRTPLNWIMRRLEVIDRGVASGSHYVECQLMGDPGTGVSMFKIIGIFAT
jgi:hypothetical protein